MSSEPNRQPPLSDDVLFAELTDGVLRFWTMSNVARMQRINRRRQANPDAALGC